MAQKYATVDSNGLVTAFYSSDINSSIPASAFPITDTQWQQWIANTRGLQWINGALQAYTPPATEPTLSQQAAQMLSIGCQITSASNVALDGTYAVDAENKADIQAEVISILLNNTFTNGSLTINWPDVTGTLHSFDITHFKDLATKLGAFVGVLKPIAAGNAGTLPSQPVAIV